MKNKKPDPDCELCGGEGYVQEHECFQNSWGEHGLKRWKCLCAIQSVSPGVARKPPMKEMKMPVPDMKDTTDISDISVNTDIADAPDVADIAYTVNQKTDAGLFVLSRRREIRTELIRMFNCLCVDNDLNTPDYLLADTVIEHLEFLGNLTKKRDAWHGFVPFADLKKPLTRES